MDKIKFVIILHNHQPVGNFDWVMGDAARDAYLPFSTSSRVTPA